MLLQKTIKKDISIEGIGLHTGSPVRLTLKPAPEGNGVTFVRTDIVDANSININSMEISSNEMAKRRTTLGFGPLQIQTTEHLLSAIAGLGVDNIIIEMDNVELPGLDGSAAGYAEAIISTGIIEQRAEKKVFDIKTPLWCAEGDSVLVALPSDNFKVTYTLSYPGIGVQFFSSVIDSGIFIKEIAPARTFCSEMEAMELLKRGLGKGANYENTLVMKPDGPINNKLRFKDEPARHKVLDLIGDIFLTGAALKAHIIAVKSGHKLNMELAGKIKVLTRASYA